MGSSHSRWCVTTTTTMMDDKNSEHDDNDKTKKRRERTELFAFFLHFVASLLFSIDLWIFPLFFSLSTSDSIEERLVRFSHSLSNVLFEYMPGHWYAFTVQCIYIIDRSLLTAFLPFSFLLFSGLLQDRKPFSRVFCQHHFITFFLRDQRL